MADGAAPLPQLDSGSSAIDSTNANERNRQFNRLVTAFTNMAAAVTASLIGGSTGTTANRILTAKGTGGRALQASSVPISGFFLSNIVQQKFTASGTYTPTAGMVFCIVEAVGSGAGGGGAIGVATGTCGGGGGGAGAYVRSRLTAAQVGASQTVTIAAAGTGGAAGLNNGATGGDVSLGSLVIAKGGQGGTASNGTGTIGSGGAGGAGSSCTGDFAADGGKGFSAGWSTDGVNTFPFNAGGGSWFGGGASNGAQSATAIQTGATATVYGAGGAGGLWNNTATNVGGGAGKTGAIIITEYIAG